MTSSPIAIRNGELTAEGEKLRDEIAADVAAEALKTDDPRAYIAAWSELFRAGMTQLTQGGGQ
jgi:hypothetical protein